MDDFVFHVLANADGDLGDMSLVAGGQAGDDFMTVAITNAWDHDAVDHLIIEGDALEQALQIYHGQTDSMIG